MDNGKIENLKRRLYKKGETFWERKDQPPLSPRVSDAKTYWEGSPQDGEKLRLPDEPKSSFAAKFFKFFIIALIIFGALTALFFIFKGPSIISSRNIEISLEGPDSVKGGEENSWQVKITNKNKNNLELADLIIEYPDGSRLILENPNNGKKNLTERISIGSIGAGETISKQINAYLFGEKESEKTFKFTLEYRLENSNAILAATQEKIVKILQSPLEISTNLSKEISAGEEISITIDVNSNSESLIKDIYFKIEYPSGFQYQDAEPKPAKGNDFWKLGDIESNKKRTIKIRGVMQGQDSMEAVFRISAGPLDEKGEIIAYGFATPGIVLKKPFLNLNVLLNGRNDDLIISPGQDVDINIEWQNTLPVKVRDATIEVKLNSSLINQRSISLTNGSYRSFDQTLVWNKSSDSDLGEIEPLAQGKAQFRFSIVSFLPSEVVKKGNPKIPLEIEMRAIQTSDEGDVEIKNHLTKEIKIATSFQISRRGLYYSGRFKNIGPLPPKSGRETTYTIVWSLVNSSSNVSSAKVSASLPPYIKWLGVFSPNDAEISYNKSTGEIIWDIGDVKAGVGVLEPAKELSFQISFLPSESQIGSQPILVSETILTGRDNFTNADMRDAKPAITTFLDNDYQFKYNEATVQ